MSECKSDDKVPEARPGLKTATLQDKNEDDQMKAYAEAINTKKWSKVQFADPNKKDKSAPNNPKIDLKNMT